MPHSRQASGPVAVLPRYVPDSPVLPRSVPPAVLSPACLAACLPRAVLPGSVRRARGRRAPWDRGGRPCSPPSPAPRSSASTGISSPSRSTSPTACPATRSSACPTPRSASHASGSGPRSLSSELAWPTKRITVNLAPGGRAQDRRRLRARGRARGRCSPTSELPAGVLDGVGVLGELGLDGSVRPVPGTLALVDVARPRRRRARSSSRPPTPPRPRSSPACTSAPPRTSPSSARCLKGEAPGPTGPTAPNPTPPTRPTKPSTSPRSAASPGRRRALEIAAAGGHHLLLTGPPGAGKTMLARRLATILPAARPRRGPRGHPHPLRRRRTHPSTASPAPGRSAPPTTPRPPPRSSAAAAGRPRTRRGHARPPRRAVPRRARRVPARTRSRRCASRSRSGWCGSRASPFAITFPADFQLVACSNPCPCGLGPPRCTCTDVQQARYRRRLSAPLLDRFDLRLASGRPNPTTAAASRRRSSRRGSRPPSPARSRGTAGSPWKRNAHIPAGALDRRGPARRRGRRRLAQPHRGTSLTGRGAARIRRVARTLADLDDVADRHRRARDARVDAPRGRAVNSRHRHRRTSRPRRSPGSPDMTPARLRALVGHFGGPAAALRAVELGTARAVPGRPGPARPSAARWRARRRAGRARPTRRGSRRCSRPGATRVWLDGRRRVPDRRRGARAARWCSSPRASPTRRARRPARRGRRDARGHAARARRRRGSSAPISPSRGSRW